MTREVSCGKLHTLKMEVTSNCGMLTVYWEQTGGEKMKTLKDVRVGETAVVRRLQGEGAVKRRIMDMGITKGVEVYVRKLAPLGDPMELTVRGYELSLRKADAEMIEVEAPEPS